MELMNLRRGLMMGMAQGGGFMDGIFEMFTHVRVEQTTTEVIVPVPNISIGCYVVVALPLVTAQDGIDRGTYIFKAGEFVVHGETSKTITNGQSYIFNRLGKSDYWGIGVEYVDATAKDSVRITCGKGEVSFPDNHDLYIIRVKGD